MVTEVKVTHFLAKSVITRSCYGSFSVTVWNSGISVRFGFHLILRCCSAGVSSERIFAFDTIRLNRQ